MTTAARIRMMCMAIVLILLAPGRLPAQQAESGGGSSADPLLDSFIGQALDRNPAVRQSFSRYQASLQRLPQVSSLPDPMLALTQYVRSPETRVGPQTTMVTISQQFPWFGKLGDKEKIAAKEAAVLAQLYEAQKAEVVRQVKVAYYNLAFVDRALAIAREDLSVLENFEALAQARYSQGVGLQQAVIKLQAEMTRIRIRLQEQESRRVDAEAALNMLMDRPAQTPVPLVPLVMKPRGPVNFEELFRIGRENRPEVQAALLQIEKDEKRIQLARRSYWPDFTIGAGMVNVLERSDPAGLLSPPPQNGKNVYSFTVGVNIPLRRRKYDAAVAEAAEDKIASSEGYRAAVNSLEMSVRAVGFRIQTIANQIDLFEKTLLPQAGQAMRSAEDAYATGAVGVLDLLDSERVLLEVRLGLARLRSDYMKECAEMERAIGAAF